MKKWILLFIGMVVSMPSVTTAQTRTAVYEPHKFTREIAKPERASDSFEVCDPKGSFTLIVDNGDEKGENRVSSGVISVNGVPIVTQRDFNRKASRIEKALTNIAATNSITVELGSKPWSHVTVSVEGMMSCLDIHITEPQEGAIINKGTTIVKGTIDSETADVGVRVNGVLAEVNGGNWLALVRLKEGKNVITATATDGSGNTDEKSIAVNCGNASQPVIVSIGPASGIAPLETTFRIDTNVGDISIYRIDFDGDGVVDLETASEENISHKYEATGLYLPVVTAENSAGEVYSETVIVNVMSLEEMDKLFKSKWSNMTNLLIYKNIDQAMHHFFGGQDSKYKKVFEDLKDYLPQIYGREATLEFVSIYEKEVQYEYIVIEEGDLISYPVIFFKDANGLWKIYQL